MTGSGSSLQQLLDVVASDLARHTLNDPSTEQELARIEAALGWPLDPGYRAFLQRFGGGMFYQDHEIYGPLRVMIHDIELVQDLLGVRRLLSERMSLPKHLLPVHRRGDVWHCLVLAEGRADVVAFPEGTGHAGFEEMLVRELLQSR